MKHELNMIDYIDWIEDQGTNPLWVLDEIIGQRNFLKSPPKLGDFVPTNEKREVMEKPEKFNDWLEDKINNGHFPLGVNCEKYQSALDRRLWAGWEVKDEFLTNGREYVGYYTDEHFEFTHPTYNELITSGIKLERIQRK